MRRGWPQWESDLEPWLRHSEQNLNVSTRRWRKCVTGVKIELEVKQISVSVPVVTSLMSSAALWQPSTSRWVQVDSSLAESTLNTWVSTPCLVPERRPNERSESRRGELFPGPEWTSLKGRGESMRRTWMRKRVTKIHRKGWARRANEGVCMFVCYRCKKVRCGVHRRERREWKTHES